MGAGAETAPAPGSEFPEYVPQQGLGSAARPTYSEIRKKECDNATTLLYILTAGQEFLIPVHGKCCCTPTNQPDPSHCL